jgi:hypothetical protein
MKAEVGKKAIKLKARRQLPANERAAHSNSWVGTLLPDGFKGEDILSISGEAAPSAGKYRSLFRRRDDRGLDDLEQARQNACGGKLDVSCAASQKLHPGIRGVVQTLGGDLSTLNASAVPV